MIPIEEAFERFKNKYFTAVLFDTQLGALRRFEDTFFTAAAHDNSKLFLLEKESEKAWADAAKAEAELRGMFPK
jgi:hypothetical protein